MRLAPIADPLPSAPQQHHQRLVPPRPGHLDQLLGQPRLQMPRQPPRHTLTQLTATPTPRRITPRHPMRALHPTTPARHRILRPKPPPSATLAIAPDHKREERRQHRQPMIDRRRLALKRRRWLARAPIDPPNPPHIHARRPALRARPELRDIRAHHRPIHRLERQPTHPQPPEEVRQPQGISALRISAATPLSQIAQERAHLAHRPTIQIDHRKRHRPVDFPAHREASHGAHRPSSKNPTARP